MQPQFDNATWAWAAGIALTVIGVLLSILWSNVNEKFADNRRKLENLEAESRRKIEGIERAYTEEIRVLRNSHEALLQKVITHDEFMVFKSEFTSFMTRVEASLEQRLGNSERSLSEVRERLAEITGALNIQRPRS